VDFSKIEAGKLKIVENDYHLATMLNDIIMGVELRIKQKNLEMKLDMDETMPSMLRGDEIRIKQILNNLLSNAIKYTEKGTVTFSAKGVYDESGFSLVLSVEDTGIGIKKEDLEKLFDSFQRLELSKNRYIEGTGLGLNITKQLVTLMNGQIEVRSEYGIGSCFTVRIPQQIIDNAAVKAAGIAAARRQPAAIHQKHRALLRRNNTHWHRRNIRACIALSKELRWCNMRNNTAVAVIILTHKLHRTAQNQSHKICRIALMHNALPFLDLLNSSCNAVEHRVQLLRCNAFKQRTLRKNRIKTLHISSPSVEISTYIFPIV